MTLLAIAGTALAAAYITGAVVTYVYVRPTGYISQQGRLIVSLVWPKAVWGGRNG